MLTLTSEMKRAFNEQAYKNQDHQFALRLRAWRPTRFNAVEDADLTETVGYARRNAVSFGLKSPTLRARWVMIHSCLAPDFWRNAAIYETLTAKTGTADIRFGDVCACMKLMLTDAGRGSEVWW